MAKYKVGDKVRVRSDLRIGERYHDMTFLNDMAKFMGQVVTINKVKYSWYGIDGYHDTFWTDEMFEGLAEEKPDKPTPKFKVGDRVKVIKITDGRDETLNELGTVIYARYEHKYPYLVEFNKDINGHDGDDDLATGKDGYCWWCHNDTLILADDAPIPTPVPAEPLTVNININLDIYANSCWHCRKGGIVDLYLNGKPGICPSCGRVCNVVQKKTKPLVEEVVTWALPKPKENKPLTKEELEALPDGTRVFVARLKKGNEINWTDERTRWRVKNEDRLNWETGTGYVTITNVGKCWNAYREEPERPF